MANLRAIHSVGNSLITHLTNVYPQALRDQFPCQFRLLSGGELVGDTNFGTTLSLFLFRVTVNEHSRTNLRPPEKPIHPKSPLGLDLHYLLTVWADNALAEQVILAWAMREIYHRHTFTLSDLSSDAGWTAEDAVQILPGELSHEDLMRIWDAIDPPYRLSVSYIARVVHIDPDTIEAGRPVVATRYTYQDEVEARR